MVTSFLHTQLLQHQRVLVRADLNVPIAENGAIKNDARLRAIFPTIKHIQAHGGKIILATHIGRPTHTYLEHQLSTRNLIPWFEQQGLKVDFESDFLGALPKTYKNPDRMMLLENLRFFIGEKQYSMPFAELLANLADIYVNDAFGTLHRPDTSVALLPRLFLPQNRGWGLLVEAELTHLEPLHDAPEQPLVLMLGGAKVEDKISLITTFLQHSAPQVILLGGKLAFPFLAAQGIHLGASHPTAEEIAIAYRGIGMLGNTKLLLPSDAVTVKNLQQIAPPSIKLISALDADDIIIDIGPESCALFKQALQDAKTIFVNGTMGINQTPADSSGTTNLLQAIAELPNCIKIAGGGDGVAAIEKLGLQKAMTFLSTGGGATLSYLASENPWQELPGLKALGPGA